MILSAAYVAVLQQMSRAVDAAPGGGPAFEQGRMGVDQILGRKS